MNNIQSIHNANSLNHKLLQQNENEPSQLSFSNLLNHAIDHVNDSQIKSNIVSQQFLNGKVDNLHNVMITAEKASVTLQAAVEVRNKVIESYKEIMRMQI